MKKLVELNRASWRSSGHASGKTALADILAMGAHARMCMGEASFLKRAFPLDLIAQRGLTDMGGRNGGRRMLPGGTSDQPEAVRFLAAFVASLLVAGWPPSCARHERVVFEHRLSDASRPTLLMNSPASALNRSANVQTCRCRSRVSAMQSLRGNQRDGLRRPPRSVKACEDRK